MKNIFTRMQLLPLLCLLALLLAACSVPGVPATSAQLPQVNAASSPQALPPIHLPQDEAPHRDLTEWWYYTGHINAVTPAGKALHYGFELVFFQLIRSDFPPVYIAHFAISDLNRGAFHYDQRRLTEPAAVIPDGTSSAGFNVGINNWSARGLNGQDHLQATMDGYTIDLHLNGLKQPTLHNGNGLITYGLGGFSYYYSRTNMAVTGTLLDHQQALQVTGQAWMDHQWGNFLTLGGGGWDWFSVQLNNGTQLMLYLLRDASGQVTSTYADLISVNGQSQLLSEKSLHIGVLDHWTSPATGITYPSGWQLKIDDPHLQSSLTLQPDLQNQELNVTPSTGNIYWEGAVTIQGQSGGQSVQGQGYVELTGYHK
jgi:predicted secreted hydrolase